MKYVISATLIVAGVIHILPLAGVLGSERLTTLYGLPFDEPNLAILMRHRAVMLGIFGALFVVAAFVRTLQPTAFVMGLITVVSFLLLTWMSASYNEQIGRVFVADVVALIALLIGGAAYIYTEIGQA